MTRTVSIDFVSDVVCPWCALATTALEQAINNLCGEVAVQLSFKPFELNPDMPAEGEDAIKHMMRKYGRSAQDVASRNEMIIARGEAIGFRFDLEKRSHFYNTFDAHRLLLWAVGEGLEVTLNKVLLKAYFTDGENISKHETLVRLAGEAGLSSAVARQVLEEGAYAAEVRELERFYVQRGIDSVPAMVVNGRQLIAGSQSVEQYEEFIRQLAQESAEA